MQTENMAPGRKSSLKLLKVLGFAAVIGIVLAVGRIVLRVFMEKPGDGDSQEGV